MHGFLGRILLGRAGPAKVALTLILIVITVTAMPVKADAPTLKFFSSDMAPGAIYIGDTHAEEMHDIVMLQITANTTYSEGVTINSITIHRTGTATDADVENINLYEDSNHNGELDHGTDTFLSTAKFELGEAEFSVLRNVTTANQLTLLVALNISGEAASGGTIGVDVPSKDNITTQELANIEFAFPVSSKNSTILLDTDGDLNPDDTDPDDDNDGYKDTIEIDEETDPLDVTSVPIDTDRDYVPDSTDTDDDNDGVLDKHDDFPLDASKSRDYTMVYIYAVIAAVLIITLILLRGKKRRARGLGRKEVSDLEDFDAEEIDKALEDDEDFNEEEFDKMLEDEGDFDGEEPPLPKP